MKDLDQLRNIFLADDVDPELRADNEQKIREWEQALVHNEAFAGWREHDVTKQILQQLKQACLDAAVRLGTDSRMASEVRAQLFAEQAGRQWLISMIEVDAKGALEQVHREIRAALNATN